MEKDFEMTSSNQLLLQIRKPIPGRLEDLPEVTQEVHSRFGKKPVSLYTATPMA